MRRISERSRLRLPASRRPRNALHRAVQVLGSAIDNPDGIGVRETAQALRLAPSTVHRALAALQQEGFVHPSETSGRYELGFEFFRLALRATDRFRLTKVALPLMRQLVDSCNETSVLSVYDPSRLEMMFALTVESSHPLRYAVEMNRWIPIHAGASGLAIMASLPPEERREVIARGLRPLTPVTITSALALERELERIRRLGYARTKGQRIRGGVGIAAPIRLSERHVSGALALTIPEQRFEPRDEAKLAKLIISFAERIADRLGSSKGSRSEESQTF